VIADASSAGVAVSAWVVNDPNLAVQLAEWGVSGIITDVPDVIAERMKESREHQG
jgi:glycerophosphoryl diester phosphodiesterase